MTPNAVSLDESPRFAPTPADHARPQCIYCGGREGVVAHREVRDWLEIAVGHWSFWRCAACDALTLNPLPKAEELAAYYPPVYCYSPDVTSSSRWKAWVTRLEHRLLYQPIYRSDARRIARNTGHGAGDGKRLLDVGCGRGLRLAALRDLGYDVIGADFDADCVRYLEHRLSIPAVHCDLVGLDRAFSHASFDVITAYYVLEHVVDPIALLDDCFQLLKPGGWLVVAVPLADSVQQSIFSGRWCQVREAPRHVSLPSQKTLRAIAERLGCDRSLVASESARACAASFATTLLPGASTPSSYGRGRTWAMLQRIAAAGLAAASVPWVLTENHLLRRPAFGVAFFHKPSGLAATAASGEPTARVFRQTEVPR